ncbi:hypothetical protein SETIT_4G279100v2 [Setaria italica]|uniref:PGG domain-containing protein n=1 Tax=Setaria italica TaxID=4555 RepID=A0A368QZ15_SETIT|nr:hypothetical protein SETIT_4G279100v2 [Setaria italica]
MEMDQQPAAAAQYQQLARACFMWEKQSVVYFLEVTSSVDRSGINSRTPLHAGASRDPNILLAVLLICPRRGHR